MNEPWQEILDREIESCFGALHEQAIAGELSDWRDSPAGRLAEIIILDQFSRNIYRDRPESFAYDATALVLPQQYTKRKKNGQTYCDVEIER